MIDRTLSNTLAIADIAPKAATKLPDADRGAGGFGEALAGAHTVHDRRESQATSHSRREWAQGDRTTERARGLDRAEEVRSDRAAGADRGDEVDASDEPVATSDAAAPDDAAEPTTTESVADGGTTDAAEAAAGEAATQATVAVAAAPVPSDGDAIVVPTTATSAAATTDAIDAAMRLAIDGGTTQAEGDAPAAVDDTAGDTQLAAALAQGMEDAETGDVEASPTRSTTSTPATTSGPSPVQQAATTEGASGVPVAAAATVEVATGEAGDVAAQLVQATVVEADGDADAPATATATAAAATDADGTAVVEEAVDDAGLGATGRANPTTNVQNPTAAAQVQAHAQAQARLAEQAADEAGDAAPAAVEGTSTQGPPLTAAARDAQLAAGVRVREGLQQGGAIQERIDHIAEQLATRLRLSHAAGGSQVQLSLKPRELGEVTVQMNVREGVVAATILVDKADTLRTLQTNIDDLKRSLEDQGLSIQQFSVDVRGDAGAGGANARAAAELRQAAIRTSTGSAASLAGATAVIPGLSGDREVDPDSLHDGDVSVLA